MGTASYHHGGNTIFVCIDTVVCRREFCGCGCSNSLTGTVMAVKGSGVLQRVFPQTCDCFAGLESYMFCVAHKRMNYYEMMHFASYNAPVE